MREHEQRGRDAAAEGREPQLDIECGCSEQSRGRRRDPQGSKPAADRKLWRIDVDRNGLPALLSHEDACLLNASNRDAEVLITLYIEEREPVGPYRIGLPARRTKHLRFNGSNGTGTCSCDTPYSAVIEANVPIVVQHTRPDSTRISHS
jgi:hypothetical protein